MFVAEGSSKLPGPSGRGSHPHRFLIYVGALMDKPTGSPYHPREEAHGKPERGKG